MPASSAASTTTLLAASSIRPPKLLHPRPTIDASRAPTEPVVGHADDDRVEHAGMGPDGGLDLLGEDLLAARVDAARAPTEEHDPALGVDRRQVARHHPPHSVGIRAERGRRLDRILPVA